MNITDLYQKIKQILDDSNVALLNKGLEQVDNLYDIPDEIAKGGVINRFPFWHNGMVTKITEEDFGGATSIRDYMFDQCDSLKSIIIPDSVTSIGNYAFYLCESLTSITIPDSVTSIGYQAFEHCTSLVSITIGNSVTSIDRNAFSGCNNITDIYLHPIMPPVIDSDVGIYRYGTTTIHVPIGSGDAYKSATNWSVYADRIVEDIEAT